MKEALGIFVAVVIGMLIALWMGVGLGLTYCVSSPNGYTHKFFKDDSKVYCEFRK